MIYLKFKNETVELNNEEFNELQKIIKTINMIENNNSLNDYCKYSDNDLVDTLENYILDVIGGISFFETLEELREIMK